MNYDWLYAKLMQPQSWSPCLYPSSLCLALCPSPATFPSPCDPYDPRPAVATVSTYQNESVSLSPKTCSFRGNRGEPSRTWGSKATVKRWESWRPVSSSSCEQIPCRTAQFPNGIHLPKHRHRLRSRTLAMGHWPNPTGNCQLRLEAVWFRISSLKKSQEAHGHQPQQN